MNGQACFSRVAAAAVAYALLSAVFPPDVYAQPFRVTQRVVFNGWREFKLACGAQLAEAPNGDLLCWWLSGGDAEPARDNCVLMTRSTDKGKTWSEPVVWMPAEEDASAVGTVMSTPDGRLFALGAYWPSEKQYTIWKYFRMESSDNGKTWTEPKPFKLRPQENVALGRVIQLPNGEYLVPASFFEERPEPLRASIADLVRAASEQEALSMPAAEGTPAWKFGTHLHGCSVFVTRDPELRDMIEYGHVANRPLGLLEPTCVQLKDGRVVMLMRAEYGGRLWRADSTDNGRTWTEAWETDIPNPSALSCLIRLPDGRIALFHNPVGQKGACGPRSPLSIWISDDEMGSWADKQDLVATRDNPRPAGWAPGLDVLAYPCALLVDGQLVCVYDRNRRQTMFLELAAL